jgi:hypothetical protein
MRQQARVIEFHGRTSARKAATNQNSNGAKEHSPGQASKANAALGYVRKRRIPKLRFFAGRLTYLATPQMLLEFNASLKALPELRLIAEVFKNILFWQIHVAAFSLKSCVP